MAAAIANALARSRTVARGVRSPSGRRKAASGASTIAYCLMPKSPPSAQGKSRGARAAQKSVSERKSTTVGSVHEPSSMKNSRGVSRNSAAAIAAMRPGRASAINSPETENAMACT